MAELVGRGLDPHQRVEPFQPRRMRRPRFPPGPVATGFTTGLPHESVKRCMPAGLVFAGVGLTDQRVGRDERRLEACPGQARRESLAQEPSGQTRRPAVPVRVGQDDREVGAGDQVDREADPERRIGPRRDDLCEGGQQRQRGRRRSRSPATDTAPRRGTAPIRSEGPSRAAGGATRCSRPHRRPRQRRARSRSRTAS